MEMHNKSSVRISAIYYCYGCLGYCAICSWVLYFQQEEELEKLVLANSCNK